MDLRRDLLRGDVLSGPLNESVMQDDDLLKSYYAARAAEYDRVYLKPQGTWHQNRVDSESIDAPHPARLARPFRIAHFFGLVHSPSAVAVRVIARSGGAAV